MADWIELEDFPPPDPPGAIWGFHPIRPYRKKLYESIASAEPLLARVFAHGKVECDLPPLTELRGRVRRQLDALHPTMRRILNPHAYKVSIGPELQRQVLRLREIDEP